MSTNQETSNSHILHISIEEEKSILNTPSTPVEGSDEEFEILKQLRDTMRNVCISKHGLGLAANQLGVLKRFFYIHVGTEGKFVINPEILDYKGIKLGLEGCLSRQGLGPVSVKRYDKIKVRYTNLDKEVVEEWLKGADAVVFQHEYDHLDGKLI